MLSSLLFLLSLHRSNRNVGAVGANQGLETFHCGAYGILEHDDKNASTNVVVGQHDCGLSKLYYEHKSLHYVPMDIGTGIGVVDEKLVVTAIN
jgi:hypothetical protein